MIGADGDVPFISEEVAESLKGVEQGRYHLPRGHAATRLLCAGRGRLLPP